MKKYILGLMILAGVWACSKEDWPDNSAPERNWLAPEEGATDETSVLRREFYDRNGIYLLFSDTLGVREKTTLAGDVRQEWQLLKRGYKMIQGDYYLDSFVYHSYATFESQKAASKFIEERLLPSISEVFWPNAILLLDRLEWCDNMYGMYMPGKDIACQVEFQAMIIALGDMAQATDAEKETLKNELLKSMVEDKASLLAAEDMALFYGYSDEYYDINSYLIPKPIESVGFLGTFYSSWTVAFNSKEYDLKAYIQEIFKLSEEEFRETYNEYPVIIKKMEALVDVLHKYGVKIYMEE